MADLQQVQGLELSYNNVLDAQAAWALVAEFGEPAAAIIKHGNPCGVALSGDVCDVYGRAHACDPRSAFGGVLGLNRPVDRSCAEELTRTFLEVVIAPGYAADAAPVLAGRPKLRVVQPGPGAATPPLDARLIAGGFLLQGSDRSGRTLGEARVVTRSAPDGETLQELQFAWTVVKHVRSNAIVLAREHAAVGIGAGQMSRPGQLVQAQGEQIGQEEKKPTTVGGKLTRRQRELGDVGNGLDRGPRILWTLVIATAG